MASPPLLSWKAGCRSPSVPVPFCSGWLSAHTNRKPWGAIMVLAGICHLVGCERLSVRKKPPRFTALLFGLYNSNQSWKSPSAGSAKPDGPALSAIHSLMTTGSSAPGPLLVTVMLSTALLSRTPLKPTPWIVSRFGPANKGTFSDHAVVLVQLIG